ncbi:DUF2652 domain-containing protein [Larkinella soli]|uniref:DUF2652 domain-containing protein n=1 Tax=Larkinella soli TaxID=1770527 RepID=UPI0013E2BE44|nr:DUF2652 domain-containing protein [Larkinella soli]
MAETLATILIPDISGFTEFMTTNELSHASHAINLLMDAMLEAVGDEYEVSEIEGDAVLLLRKGPAPTREKIQETCLKIFNAFHFRRAWLQQYTICPCGACQAIINLSLKFVVHHGPLAEIKVGKFVKHSGPDMIVAHRLLKNNIGHTEYLLVTEKLLEQAADSTEHAEWSRSFDEYASLGRVHYRFSLLSEARRLVPKPPEPPGYASTDSTSYLELPIQAPFQEVYMVVANMAARSDWVPGLREVGQDRPEVFIGSRHLLRFDTFQALVSPVRMTISEEGILYAENWRIEEQDLSLIFEYVFRNQEERLCGFAARFLNAGDTAWPDQDRTALFRQLQDTAVQLKTFCEKNFASSGPPGTA